jgi:hypothetical protein
MTCPTPETRDAEWSVAADLIQAATPLCVRRDRSHFKPPKQFREFPFERLEFNDLMPHCAQLLGHESLESGTNGDAFRPLELTGQDFQLWKGQS